MTVEQPESANRNTRLNTLLDKVRRQLQGFTVRDQQSQVLGEVKDLTLDTGSPAGQFNLVVSHPTSQSGDRFYLLSSKTIQKINPPTQSIFINMSQEEVNRLPDYPSPEVQPSETGVSEARSESTNVELPNLASPTDVPAAGETQFDINNQLDLSSYNSPGQPFTPEVIAHDEVQLLEERLVVDRSKRKVGEVIVRKEVETRIVEVPVRREKLIVEQISPEHKQLAEIDLGQGEITGVDLAAYANADGKPRVSGEFTSPRKASQLLDEIAKLLHHRCEKVRIELVLQDTTLQETYQEWFDRYNS